MANTVVGFFRKRSEAEDAVMQLTNSGFDHNDIDVSYGRSTDADATGDSNDTDYEHEHHKGNAISRFFNSLFGDDSDDARKYTDASKRADSIVTVHASNTESAEEAANILDASGAMDIDEGSLTDQTYQDTRRTSADHSTVRSDGPISAGLSESDLAAAGVTSSQISDAETEAARYSSFDLASTGGIAPGITGAPTTGDLTTAGDPDEFINRDNAMHQQNSSALQNTSESGAVGDNENLRMRREATDDLNTWGTTANADRNTDSPVTASARDTDDYTRAGSRDDLSGTDYAENERQELRNRSEGFSHTGETGTGDNTSNYSSNQYGRGADNDDAQKIDVVKEDLHVGKKTVDTGGVRVRSRIVERPVEQHLRLREENVRLHREPVNRVATDEEIRTFRDMEIELTERAEVPVVNKEARVVEEISVSRDVNERDETVRDTVRETQVDIDDKTNRRDSQR